MKALRDVEADLYRFRARVLAATVLVGLAFALLLLRLGYLQWWRYDDYKALKSPQSYARGQTIAPPHALVKSSRCAVFPLTPSP